jgi:hypothetical protein
MSVDMYSEKSNCLRVAVTMNDDFARCGFRFLWNGTSVHRFDSIESRQRKISTPRRPATVFGPIAFGFFAPLFQVG